jgi:hypothetical protein
VKHKKEAGQSYFWGDSDLDHYHLEEGCVDERSYYCHWYYFWGKDFVTAL